MNNIKQIAYSDIFPELETLPKAELLPKQITTVLVRISFKNLKIVDCGQITKFKHLKVLENIQTIYLKEYIFLSIKNFGHTPIFLEDDHNMLACGLCTS